MRDANFETVLRAIRPHRKNRQRMKRFKKTNFCSIWRHLPQSRCECSNSSISSILGGLQVRQYTTTCTRDIREKCLSVITAIFWEVKYDRTFSSVCAFSQPSARLGGTLTVRRLCLRESCLSESKCYAWCLSESKCYAWCLSKSICSTWCLKISKILVRILHPVLKLKVDLSLVLKLKFWYEFGA